jgi:hypothetical protein
MRSLVRYAAAGDTELARDDGPRQRKSSDHGRNQGRSEIS